MPKEKDQRTETERQLIGSLMVAPEQCEQVSAIISERSFCDASCRAMWEAITALIKLGKPVDPPLVKRQLFKHNNLSRVGELKGIVAFIDDCIYGTQAVHYAEIIAEEEQQRHIRIVLQNAMTKVGAEPTDILIADTITNLEKSASTQDEVMTVKDMMIDNRNQEAQKKISTGFKRIDELCMGGINQSVYMVVAGRTGCGKTDFLLNLALNMNITGAPISSLYINLEMDRTELDYRLVANKGDLPKQVAEVITRGNARKYTMDTYADNYLAAMEQVSRSKMLIDTAGHITPHKLRALVAKYHRDVDVIFLDYLQLVTGEGKEYERVTEVSLTCKQLTNKYRIPIIAAAQLNRVGARERDPSIHDLKGSGQIENDADMILLLSRENEENSHVKEEELKVVIAKHRGYPKAVFNFDYSMQTGVIRDNSKSEWEEEDAEM